LFEPTPDNPHVSHLYIFQAADISKVLETISNHKIFEISLPDGLVRESYRPFHTEGMPRPNKILMLQFMRKTTVSLSR
jgi:hypothetical protein